MKDGFINLNKSLGLTSHDVVNHIRKIFSTKKVGHAGTLDPSASGVLPIAVGRATKFIEYLSICKKTYQAEILFGIATESGDLEGKIIEQDKNFSVPSLNDLKNILKKFTGEIIQTPPKFSAIKIHGRKAYELARSGIEFKLPRRRVEIFKLELLKLMENSMIIEIECSSGTYVRSLAIDIGQELRIPSTLKNLNRLNVGRFALENSLKLEEVKKNGDDCLQPIENCLKHLPLFELAIERKRAFLNGLPTNTKLSEKNFLRIFSGGKFLGIGKITNGELRSTKIA